MPAVIPGGSCALCSGFAGRIRNSLGATGLRASQVQHQELAKQLTEDFTTLTQSALVL
jgi:hypothetical protein